MPGSASQNLPDSQENRIDWQTHRLMIYGKRGPKDKMGTLAEWHRTPSSGKTKEESL